MYVTKEELYLSSLDMSDIGTGKGNGTVVTCDERAIAVLTVEIVCAQLAYPMIRGRTYT